MFHVYHVYVTSPTMPFTLITYYTGNYDYNFRAQQTQKYDSSGNGDF